MGDVIIGKDVILQEYEPLHNLLQLLPTKAQLGPKSFVGQVRSLKERGVKHLLSSLKEKAHDNLRNIPVSYTCFEISHHIVVLGSNLGIIFFYDRNNSKLTRLGSEANHEPVTCLRLLPLQSSIAAGFNNGHIFIYSYMLSSQGLNKHECMQVLGAHSSSVTCLEWSPDGTVLYSGDNDGRIVMTVVKVMGGVTQSALLFVEDTPIVQLSYSSMALLVSTYKRTVTWSFTSEEPIQVGQKDRKSPGNYGACFFPPAKLNDDDSDRELTIYASRPGLRLWTAQPDGKVSATLMYKGLMSENPPGIRTLTPLPSPSLAQATRAAPASAMQFGTLEIFHGQFILTWDQHRLWLLDTSPCAVVCFHHYFHGDIVDVCPVGHEVFILQQSGPRLIRKFSLIPKLPNPLVRVAEILERSWKEEEGEDNDVASYAKNDTKKDKDSPPPSRPPCKDMPLHPTSAPSPGIPSHISPGQKKNTVTPSKAYLEPEKPTQYLADLAFKIQHENVDDCDEIVFKKKRTKKKPRGDESPKAHAIKRFSHLSDDTETTNDEISDISSELDYADRSVSTTTSDEGGEGSGEKHDIEDTDGREQDETDLVGVQVNFNVEDEVSKCTGLIEGERDRSVSFPEPLLQRRQSNSSTGTLERTLSPESTATNTPAGTTPSSNTPTKKLSREEELFATPPHSLEESSPHSERELLQSYPKVYSDVPLNISDLSFSDKSMDSSCTKKKHIYSPVESNLSVIDSSAEERQTDSEGTPPVCFDSEGGEELQDTSSWTSSTPRTLSEVEYSSVEICRSIEASQSSVKSNHSQSSKSSARSLHLLVDSWSDRSGPNPGHAISLASSDTHLWCVNNYEQIFYCPTRFEVLSWTRLDGEAKMVAVNTTGDVIWTIDRKNYAYTRKGITESNLIGREWHPVEKDMRFVAVEETAVWGIKMNGDVFVRTDVTKATPEGKNWRTISINTDFLQASCFDGLVWFLDRKNFIHVYKSADRQAASPENWKALEGITARWTCLSVEGVAWIIDTKGALWFSGNVTRDNPLGGTWYQVSLGQYLMHDPSLLDTIWSWVRPGDETKMITASPKAGLWILGRNGSLNACRGHLLGSSWESMTPHGMARSVFWSYISASTLTASNGKGHIWALQPNGELVCFNPGSRPIAVEPPRKGGVLKLVAASSKTVWGITHNFKVVQLIGTSELCPQGVEWVKVPLENFQIGRVCHLSSGSLSTWAVEETGQIWLRIGGTEDHDHKISQVWLPVDGEPLSNCRFVKVAVSPDDTVVWALDDRFNVYARKCVTPDFPLGTSWDVVPGIGVRDMCICASHTVWAVCTNGDVACRFGVSPSNFLGDYWKKVPGNYELISVTLDGELWAIDQNGQLFRRRTQHFYGTQSPFKPRTYSALFPGEEEWELI